jgi:NADH-quinone oxidoreductase subunit N
MLNEMLILMRQELALIVLILLLLLMKLGKDRSNDSLLGFIHLALLINLLVGFLFFERGGFLFGDMFNSAPFLTVFKSILNLALLLISLQSHAWLSKHDHLIEFYVLLLTSLLGMNLMISSGNMLLFYLGLEMSTIPAAAAANFELRKRNSSEAAFKLIISSAFSSGLLLMGISFFYGATGSLNIDEASHFVTNEPLQILSFILVLAVLGFKISAVPFHWWTADVYEGSPVAVTSFLSVVSKSAAVFVLVSFLFRIYYAIGEVWTIALSVLAVVTILIGNLFALRQDNIKRLLAFSSIAQVGFILVAVISGSVQAVTAVVFFLLIYVFSNLAAFGIVSVISYATGKEKVSDYAGLSRSNPMLAWILAIALFSLAGIPPTAGFFAKFFLLMEGASTGNFGVVGFAAANMVISFYYYLKLVKLMFMDEGDDSIGKISVAWESKLALFLCTAGILITGVAGVVYDSLFALISGN